MNFLQALPTFRDDDPALGHKLRELVRILEAPEQSFITRPIVIVAATYQTAKDAVLVLADATAAPFNVTLPDASKFYQRAITVKKIDVSANAVTIDTVLTQTIDGAATQMLATQWLAYTFTSNGVAWFITAAV